MTNDQIKEIALANGFKLKEQPNGTKDLNPYVYDFARALIDEYEHYVDGKAVTDENGKIIKGSDYFKPQLEKYSGGSDD